MTNGELQRDIRTVEKIYEIVKSEFDFILNIDTGHAQRAATVFSFGGVILSIAFALYPRGIPFPPLFIIGVCVLCASLVLSFFAIKTWKIRGGPTPRVLAKKYIDIDYESVLRQVISVLIDALTYNKKKAFMRGLIVDWALVCVVVGVIFLASSVLVN